VAGLQTGSFTGSAVFVFCSFSAVLIFAVFPTLFAVIPSEAKNLSSGFLD
jgi:hypothetical protein